MSTETAIVIIIIMLIILILCFAIPIGLSISHNSLRNRNFERNAWKLKVLNREKGNRALFKIRNSVVMSGKYHPATATITAATVGGVTTGGVEFKDAHYTLHNQRGGWNDTYELLYIDRDEYFSAEKDRKERHTIEELILKPEDVSVAKNHPILNKYLDGNKLVLQNKESNNLDALAVNAANKYGTFAAAEYITAAKASHNLTYQELSTVLDFLAGEI